MNPEILYFKVNAELKDVVGRDLINDDNIAITELVKNSYDANSPYCIITFLNENCDDQEKSFLSIQDFGHGMEKEDIIDKWLNIAYSEKKLGQNIGGRKVSGNKGVGRFSCDRLGKKLKLYSRKEGSTSYVSLTIDWPSFEDKGKNIEISDIPIEFEEIPQEDFTKKTGFDEFLHGTSLHIYPLRGQWDRGKLLTLRRSLERFINPNQAYDAHSFRIKINAASQIEVDRKSTRSRDKVNGDVQNTIFNELGLKTSYIISSIDSTGTLITTSLYHRGDKLFTLIEANKFSLLKDVKITIYFLNQYHKAYFHRESGIQAVEYGSIFLFLNGFRVPPYGERFNDWLGLDNRKTQGTQRYLGTRDIMGRIEISDPTNVWRVISSREGIVHTNAFRELTDSQHPSFFYSILRKLERYIVDGLSWDSTPEKWFEINKKVLSDKSKNTDEKYTLPEKEKNVQVIKALQDIIRQGTNIEDIVSLELDTSLVKILSEQEEAQRKEFINEFSIFAEKFEDKSLRNSKKQVKNFLEKASAELAKVQKERNTAQAEVQKAREQLKKSEKSKTALRQENLFLKAQKNRDIDDIIDLHHQVITWGQIISKNCDTLISKTKKRGQLSQNELMDSMTRIRMQAHKILKVAKLATNANFRVKAVDIEANIIIFIHDYLNEISRTKLFKDINISFLPEEEPECKTRFTPIEITIFIDSLISNSKKAKATRFTMDVVLYTEPNFMHIIFDDNGSGLSNDIQDQDSIFTRGVTTTDGSGIGLNHAKKIIEQLGGTLALTQSNLGGFALLVRLPHEA